MQAQGAVTRVLVIQEVIEHYRFALYDALIKARGLHICGFYHIRRSDHPIPYSFPTLQGRSLRLGLVSFQLGYWKQVIGGEYNAVIAPFNIRIISNIVLLALCRLRKVPFLWWGIGFGRHRGLDRLRVLLIRLADAAILYEDSAAQKMTQLGINRRKLFVMHNTVHVAHPSVNLSAHSRTSFLFIGSLHKRKQVDVILRAFAGLLDAIPDHICVDIVGDGDERRRLEALADELQIGQRVRFHGYITDEYELQPIFGRALLSVSPGQAGLSVLESFAHGVGFVSASTAVSGGEIENIIGGTTGFLYSGDIRELENILALVANTPQIAVDIGRRAYQYYVGWRRMDQMASVFLDAIQYAQSANSRRERSGGTHDRAIS